MEIKKTASLSRSERKIKLVQIQGGRCYLCGRVFSHHNRFSPLRPTVEHINPRSKQGSSAPPNIAIAHAACNASKGNRDARACEILLGQILADLIGHKINENKKPPKTFIATTGKPSKGEREARRRAYKRFVSQGTKISLDDKSLLREYDVRERARPQLPPHPDSPLIRVLAC